MTFAQGAGVLWPGSRLMTYSRPSSVKPPKPLWNDALPRPEWFDGLGDGGARRLERRRQALRGHAPLYLLGHGLDGAREDDAGHGLEQHPVFLGKLFRAPDEDAARPVENQRFRPRVYQAHDLILKDRSIAGEVLVQDHQVGRQALVAPVAVRLQRVPHQVDAIDVADAYQDDGQVSGDAEAPETRTGRACCAR